VVAYVFDNLITQGVRSGQIPARTRQSREWYRRAAQNTNVAASRLMSENRPKQVSGSGLEVGSMYLFNYDPKYKKELPYYDTFPLVFPIEEVKGGFLGLNMHYLPLRMRARLMDALYSLSSDKRYDENTKLRLSYNLLQASARYKLFKPTIKKYLRSRVKSRFMKVDAVEWDIALFLPIQKFNKASAEQVYRDSREMVT
jgi:hypothetical protein